MVWELLYGVFGESLTEEITFLLSPKEKETSSQRAEPEHSRQRTQQVQALGLPVLSSCEELTGSLWQKRVSGGGAPEIRMRGVERPRFSKAGIGGGWVISFSLKRGES